MLKQVPHFFSKTCSELLVWDRWFTSVSEEEAVFLFWTRVPKIHLVKLIGCPPCRFDAFCCGTRFPNPLCEINSSRVWWISHVIVVQNCWHCHLSLNRRPTSVWFDAAPKSLAGSCHFGKKGSQTHFQVLCRQNAKIHSCGQLAIRCIIFYFFSVTNPFLTRSWNFILKKSLCEIDSFLCFCRWFHHVFVETGSQIHSAVR